MEMQPDEAINILREQYQKRKSLRSLSPLNKIVLVTEGAHANLKETYFELGLESGLSMLEDGRVFFRGIPVLIIPPQPVINLSINTNISKYTS